MSTDESRYAVADLSHQHSSALAAVEYAIAELQGLLAKPRFSIPKGESRVYVELRRDMPYVIHETALPGTQILVNRNYKPLGNNSRAHRNQVNYEQHLVGHVRLTPEQIASVVSPGRQRGLFGDENPPWSGKKAALTYLARLERLRELLSSTASSAA